MAKKTVKAKCWDLLSRIIRIETPFCQVCGKPSNQVHHIVPRSRGNAVYFLERNLIALCSGCHMGWHLRWSPEEIDEIVFKVKGDFSDVEKTKNIMVKFSKNDYKEMYEDYKVRLAYVERSN